MTTTNLLIPIEELYRIFEYFNRNLYSDALSRPIITIASKRGALGWCTVSKVWTNEDQTYYEIGITAEFLNRPYEEIAETLLHEMVHLYNLQNDIKDGSGYKHNKRFKAEAEAHGLSVERSDKYGWAHTKLTQPVVDLLNAFEKNESAFGIYKIAPEDKGKTTVKPVRYVCPKCGSKVQSKEELEIICKECQELFEVVSA